MAKRLGQWYVLAAGSLPVDVDPDLRHVHPEAGEDSSQLGLLVGLGEECLRGLKQLTLAQCGAILHLHLEAAGGAEPLNGRRREHGDEGLLNRGEASVQRLSHGLTLELRLVSLLERLEREEHNALIGGVHEPVHREPGELHPVRYRRMLQGDGRHLPEYRVGAVKRGGIRKLGDPHQVLLVLRGDEPSGNQPEDQHRERQQPGVHRERPARPNGEALYGAPVPLRAGPEEPVERPEDPAQAAVEQPGQQVTRRLTGLEQDRRQRRRQRQRVDRGDHGGEGDGERELAIELPGEPG